MRQLNWEFTLNRIFVFSTVLILALFASSTSHADFVIDNFTVGGDSSGVVIAPSGATLTITPDVTFASGTYTFESTTMPPEPLQSVSFIYDFSTTPGGTIAGNLATGETLTGNVTVPFNPGVLTTNWDLEVITNNNGQIFSSAASSSIDLAANTAAFGSASTIEFLFTTGDQLLGVGSNATFGGGDLIALTDFTGVPEPSAILLFGSVLAGMAVRRRRGR